MALAEATGSALDLPSLWDPLFVALTREAVCRENPAPSWFCLCSVIWESHSSPHPRPNTSCEMAAIFPPVQLVGSK